VPVHHSGALATAYEISGTGPAILLLHGAEADHRMFGPLVAELASHATVVAYDQRDCGATRTSPAGRTGSAGPGDSGYGLVDLADDAADLLDGLGLVAAHVVGQSLGGAVAQLLALRHPARVDHLVLASSFRAGSSLLDINPAGVTQLLALRADGDAAAARIAAFFTSDEFVAANPGFVDAWRALVPVAAPKRRQRRLDAILRPVEPVDLGRITQPTLVLAGDRDRLVPAAHSHSLADEIPGAEWGVLPGVGHVSPLQSPGPLAARILAFAGVAPDRRPGAA
jgi:pimeloyl-ACP methyl ester carboxylesterase